MDFFFQTTPTAQKLTITDEAEACAAVLIACLRSNELDADAVNQAFLATINGRNVFKGYDTKILIEKAVADYEQAGGPAAVVDAAIGAIREQTRLPLFYHCLDVIMADGVVTPSEHKIFQYLKGKFKVADETAFQALEVMLTKNLL